MQREEDLKVKLQDVERERDECKAERDSDNNDNTGGGSGLFGFGFTVDPQEEAVFLQEYEEDYCWTDSMGRFRYVDFLYKDPPHAALCWEGDGPLHCWDISTGTSSM